MIPTVRSSGSIVHAPFADHIDITLPIGLDAEAVCSLFGENPRNGSGDVYPGEYRPGKVKAISEELCGHSFSASAISGFNKKLNEELGRFAHRELESEYPYLILDARQEKVRENAVIRSRAVLVAIGIDWEDRRQMLGVEMANRESSTSWKDFLLGLKGRGLRGIIFVVSDDHPGLKRAITEVLPEAYWQPYFFWSTIRSYWMKLTCKPSATS
jgi:transposase-like protein